MKLTAGKHYWTREGTKVLLRDTPDEAYPFAHDNGFGPVGFHGVDKDGKSCIGDDDCDIVAEWGRTSDDGLRDQIAIAAMAAIIGKTDIERHLAESDVMRKLMDEVARGAYLYADAMIRERSK